MRYRLAVAVILGLFLGVGLSDSLIRSRVTPGTRHWTVQLWSFPIYEEDQPVREMDGGGINISLEEPLFAQIMRTGVVLLVTAAGAFAAYRFGYAMLFWVLVVLLLAFNVPGSIVRTSWFSGTRNVTVEVLQFRVYEADNGFGVNNEDWRGDIREPAVALVWRVAVALLIVGVGVFAACMFRMRNRQRNQATTPVAVPGGEDATTGRLGGNRDIQV
jgi:hypothetical protein